MLQSKCLREPHIHNSFETSLLRKFRMLTIVNRQECTITTRQAVHFADQLEAFALCNPDVISVEHMLTLGRIKRELQQKQLSNLRQADIATMFAPM
jgi:hypothetical protein